MARAKEASHERRLLRFKLLGFLAVCASFAACGPSSDALKSGKHYPFLIRFPTQIDATKSRRIVLNSDPWLCNGIYKKRAASVLEFVDENVARAKADKKAIQFKHEDKLTGWQVKFLPARQEQYPNRLNFVIFPGFHKNASAYYEAIGRCKPINFGTVEEAQRFGLQTTVNRLFYSSDFGLYLVRP